MLPRSLSSHHIVPSLVALSLLTAAAVGQTNNPIAGSIDRTDFSVRIEPFVTLPDSGSGNAAPPRLNLLTTANDGSGRLFVNDQRGPLYTIAPDRSVGEYLDLRDYPLNVTTATGEQGFQSFAFHPDFANIGATGFGRFYTIHSSSNRTPTADFTPGGGSNTHDSVLLEWQAADPTANTFTAANAAVPFRELLRIQQPFTNHNAGQISFNPNAASGHADRGNLYLAFGDGGSGGDPLEHGQNPGTPYGSILRIDPLGSNSSNGRYGSPADNPFVGDGNAATLDEVYAYGFRNPQRFTWDTAGNGEMFIADIGQNNVEEIDIGESGGNFGWDEREGSFVYFDGGPNNGAVGANSRGDAATTGFTYPTAEYDHTGSIADLPADTVAGNRAVTVGDVLRGGSIPDLEGMLLFGDFPTGAIFILDADAPPDGGQGGIRDLRLIDPDGDEVRLLDLIREARAARGLSSVNRTDLRFSFNTPDEIYILNKQDGIIRRLTAIPEPASAMLLLGALPLLMRRRQ